MNITDTIEPKVDQLTADHLIGRTMTIRVTEVELTGGEQPCEIHYEGENGLPYRPGKSMRRVLVHVWGGDVNKYVGRSMRLYRDDDVQFGGLKVGGVRISHMSDIAAPVTMALTAKKGSKKAFKVLPLVPEKPAAPPMVDAPRVTLRDRVSALYASLETVKSADDLDALLATEATKKLRDHLRQQPEGSSAATESVNVEAAIAKAFQRHAKPPADDLDDDFPGTIPEARA